MSDAKRRPAGLGRGLSALLGDPGGDTVKSDAPTGGVRMVSVSALAPHPDQPRRRFDDAALDELAASIAHRGIIQPIIVRRHGQDFQIVAGERRWRAAQRARLHEVPVVIRDFTDAETLEVALIENIQRQDLNAIEEAEAYRRLIAEFGHSHDALAKIIDKSRSHVANLLRLLDLPGEVQTFVVDGRLTMGHARALIGADDPRSLADQVIARGLTVRDTEKLVKGARDRTNDAAAKPVDPDIAALEAQLADMLGLAVRVNHGEKGGTITLGYSTLDQLDLICQRLSGDTL